MKIAIVGAGFSGAVIAYHLAKAGYQISVFDGRSHVSGNCHTYRDDKTDIMIHAYGPHIFHTNNQLVWDFVNQFSTFEPFTNRVKAVVENRVFSLPINLHTINQFFDKNCNPEEAKEFISQIGYDINNPITFEDQALKFLGKLLFEAFFESYTVKQWGIPPSKLPASILKRLPIRFNYNDNYYSDRYQGIPTNGYTTIVQKILDDKNIKIYLNHQVRKKDLSNFDHVFYSGTLDSWFNYKYGALRYRTLDFERGDSIGDYQGCAVMNYCDKGVPWTRITEHKHFTPWNNFKDTVYFREFSRDCEIDDIPYYPIRLTEDETILTKYVDLAKQEPNVTFVGRLGTYRYLDMDVTIAEAIETANAFLKERKTPVFLKNPLIK